MTYFRQKANRSTICDNCNRPLSTHKYVTTDRDGDLHECAANDGEALFNSNEQRAKLNKQRTKAKTQSQESLTDQLFKLIDIANREGLYDAADFVRDRLKKP